MRADLFTKAYTNSDKWVHARSLIGVVDYPEWLLSPQLSMGGPIFGGCTDTPATPAKIVEHDYAIQFDLQAEGKSYQILPSLRNDILETLNMLQWPNETVVFGAVTTASGESFVHLDEEFEPIISMINRSVRESLFHEEQGKTFRWTSLAIKVGGVTTPSS